MHRLILLRHAKADRPPGLDDHERPLAASGREDAGRTGAYLAREHLLPDYALVSSARRARETWGAVSAKLGEDVPVISEAAIYEAAPETLLGLVRAIEDGARTVLMIGHNPGFQELASLLVGHGDRYAFQRLSQGLPTSGLVVLDFPTDSWREAAPRAARLDRVVTPSQLGGRDDG